MDRTETFHLFVLLGHEFLVHGCDLDEHVVVGKVEVGCEVFGGFTIFIKLNRKTPRLVVPWNSIEVEKEGELTLTVVSELDFGRRGAIGDQVTPTSTTPVYSTSSGNN
jgi:hypothetical protein